MVYSVDDESTDVDDRGNGSAITDVNGSLSNVIVITAVNGSFSNVKVLSISRTLLSPLLLSLLDLNRISSLLLSVIVVTFDNEDADVNAVMNDDDRVSLLLL